MIISHQHRFIFAAVPKTGTHSVRQALREHMSEDDIEQVGLFVNKRFPYEDLAAIRHGHLALKQVRPHLGEDAFADYFKFAFVRNPFDRFVSYCAFMTRDGDLFGKTPQTVMEHFLFVEPPEQHILFQPQASVLVDDDGSLLTDVVGRVEDMQTSYDAICARIGIPTRLLEQVNSSKRGDYRGYYTDTLREGVAVRYAQDLALFGYRF
ncbi:MAG: sulfotransferase family 2 domain-containing protein [Thermomonas sp.]